MSLEELFARQQETGEEIRRMCINYKKDAPSRKTFDYLKSKLRQLEELWKDFEDTDQLIRTQFGTNLGHPYFVKDYYTGIATGYNGVRADIDSRLEAYKQDPSTMAQQQEATGQLREDAGVVQGAIDGARSSIRVLDSADNVPKPVKRQSGTHLEQGLIRKQQAIINSLRRTLDSVSMGLPQSQSFYHLKVRTIENLWNGITDIHHQLCEQTVELHELGYDSDAYYDFEEEVQAKLIELNEKISPTVVQASPHTTVINSNIAMKLPKIVIPKFNGDYLNWRQFRDLFTELVHNQPIADCQKLWYLKTSLEGEAERLITHLTTSDTNYQVAWRLVTERYENTRLLVTALINKLLGQPTAHVESAVTVRTMHDTTQECLFALENLGVTTKHWDPLLLHILIKKLDKSTHMLWEQSLKQPRNLPTITEFLTFLEARFQSLEALGNKGKQAEEKSKKSHSLTSTVTTDTKCPCKDNHRLFACPKFIQMSSNARLKFVKDSKGCVNCLKMGHSSRDCQSRGCRKCSKRHNTLLHLQSSLSQGDSTTKTPSVVPPSTSTNEGNDQRKTSLTANTIPSRKGYVLLSTVMVEILDKSGRKIQCRAILDSGSQLNFISERMVRKLGLKESAGVIRVEGIGQRTQKTHHRVNITINSRINGFSARLEAYVLPHIISQQPAQPINKQHWPIPDNTPLADPRFNHPDKIDLLIGAELYYSTLLIGQIKLGDGLPILQNTVFGWTAAGKVDAIRQSQATCGICSEDELDQQLERFWKLEEPSAPKGNLTITEKRCEAYYTLTTKRDSSGRFVVKLPFLTDPNQLGESKDIALQRFSSLERRLARHPDLKDQYTKFMNEYAMLGHMKEVELSKVDHPYYFLPHHCVTKPESSTTKLRVVFDGASKTSSNISLNEILSKGPTVQDDVFSILLRFRMPRFVFTADIEKMYRQVKIDEDDQKYQLIWWRSDPRERLKCFQLTTVTYGTTCAPYLATRCLQKLAQDTAEILPLGAEVLARDFYVDDVLTGSDSLAMATEVQHQLQKILQSAGFKLRKWCANHPRLLQSIPQEDQELQLDFTSMTEDNVKTIGLTWLPKSDDFIIKTSWKEGSRITKRTALSDISHVFDPLGIVAPVTIIAKMFLQDLWELKLDWDAALPQDLHTAWIHYREGLKSLNSIKIPRHVSSHRIPLSRQLHVFADASERAYGAAAYIRSVDKENMITVRLLCAKSRVAPKKKVTIPRLELCAAKLAAELADRVKRDLRLTNETIFLWTDSEIVLSWINSSSSSYQTFVSNRIATIQELSIPQQWRHVPSKDNPADILSRGIAPEKLQTCNLWFYGPPFLHGVESIWPAPFKVKSLQSDPERKRVVATTTIHDAEHFISLVDHKNSFRKLQRITAYVLRYVSILKQRMLSSEKNLDKPKHHGLHSKDSMSLTTQELDDAETAIIRHMQDREFKEDLRNLKKNGQVAKTSSLSSLTPFLDDYGIIRVGGRLEASNLSYNAKHPVLMPYCDPLTKLLINDIHKESYHVGPQALLSITRQRYWPLKGKTLVRSVVQHCVQCAKARPKLLTQLMGNLPKDRVQPARPFVNVGIDFCGPCYTHFKIRGKRPQKSYIAVFCCFATKATHLEVVSDLSTQGFLGALKRFMGRRGHCKSIYCDNATNFVGAKNVIEEVKDMMTSDKEKATIITACSSKGIDFHFIPPRAPHFGGLWEAAVKSAKHLLYTTLSNASLTYEELETAIIDIEAILNSRPITPLSTDPNDLTALTPGHFLIGEPLTSSIDSRAESQQMNLATRWKAVSQIKNEFWRRWSSEYLNQLQHRYKWKQRCQEIKTGDMVIIKEDNTPILKWSLGRIENTITGQDGLIRVADVRTATGTLRRPIHKLAPLPIDDGIMNNDNHDALPHKVNSSQSSFRSPNNKYSEQEDKNAAGIATVNPRKKIRLSPGSALVTLLLTCLLLPSAKGSHPNIFPFKSQPGIYFENLGGANVISSEWNIIAYYNLEPYWKEFSSLLNCTTQLNKLCTLMTERKTCSQIVAQFRHLNEELSKNNEFLTPQPDRKRSKRGAVNIIGNLANALFGVLDSEYAEKMSQTIDDINENEEFLFKLIKNQTSVIDATINVMHKKEEAITKHFERLATEVDQINNEMAKIKEETFEERLSRTFMSLGIQTLLISSNFQRAQDAIVDTVIDTNHGKISPQLISPGQLRAELTNIKDNLPHLLKLPLTQDDILRYYNLMTIQGRATRKHVIFKIKVPLTTLDEFELFKVTPVPVLVNDTFVIIRPSFPYLIINLHRDRYYPLTEQELSSCVTVTEDKHLCRQNHPIYHKGSLISACEVQFLNHQLQSEMCQVMTTEDGPHWIQLHTPNQWIYALKKKTTVNIVCGDNMTEASLEGSGIIKLQGNCIVKQPLITLRGHNIFPANSRLSYIPSSNLTESVLPDKLAPMLHHTPHYQPHLAELEAIKKQLANMPSELPAKIHGHDLHQFTIGYVALFLIVAAIVFLVGKKFIARRSASSTIGTPANIEDPGSSPGSSFNANFNV